MIDNINNILPAIINTLIDSSLNFYPTGSRYFGGVTKDSDWDFFVEDSGQVRGFLDDLGFTPNDSETYDDSTVVGVWSYYTNNSRDKGLTKIDVQLVGESRISSKLMVQRLLKDHFGNIGLPGDKQTQRDIWKLMFRSLTTLGIA